MRQIFPYAVNNNIQYKLVLRSVFHDNSASSGGFREADVCHEHTVQSQTRLYRPDSQESRFLVRKFFSRHTGRYTHRINYSARITKVVG